MKKIFQLSLLVLALIFAFNVDAEAQRRKKKKKKKKTKTTQTDDYFDESGNIGTRLWYGANVGNLGLFGGQFSANVSPMVGYKITDMLSAGLITKLDYSYERINGIPGVRKFETLNFSYGALARFRVLPAIFLHAEIESTSFQNIAFDQSGNINIVDGEIETFRDSEPYLYLGAGYQSGNSLWGYEISLFYNVLDKATYNRIPWDFRIGFNYNF